MKKIYLIGKNIDYSKSPLLQNSLLKKLGIDDIKYEIKELEECEIESFLKDLDNNDDVLGANVTIPYKNFIGENFSENGSTNIIFKRDGELKFSSTDFVAAFEAISEKIPDIKNWKIFIIGNGGMADSFVHRFRNFMSSANDVGVYCRNPKKTYYQEYSLNKISSHSSIYKNSPILYINCTPVKEESLVPKEILKENDVVFDTNYDPHETKMIKDAKEAGCEIIYGIDMLIYNSIFSLQMFLNQELNVEELRDFLKNTLDKPI